LRHRDSATRSILRSGRRSPSRFGSNSPHPLPQSDPDSTKWADPTRFRTQTRPNPLRFQSLQCPNTRLTRFAVPKNPDASFWPDFAQPQGFVAVSQGNPGRACEAVKAWLRGGLDCVGWGGDASQGGRRCQDHRKDRDLKATDDSGG
jgi:hypothetical protein